MNEINQYMKQKTLFEKTIEKIPNYYEKFTNISCKLALKISELKKKKGITDQIIGDKLNLTREEINEWGYLGKDLSIMQICKLSHILGNEIFDVFNVQNKNIFIVVGDSGDYDTYHTWIEGVYDNLEDAENFKKEVEEKAKRIKNNCPVKYSLDMSESDEEIYYAYWTKNNNSKWMEFNGISIEAHKISRKNI